MTVAAQGVGRPRLGTAEGGGEGGVGPDAAAQERWSQIQKSGREGVEEGGGVENWEPDVKGSLDCGRWADLCVVTASAWVGQCLARVLGG